ncbi:MAG: hypothetical protein EYC68_01360 [Chloroflexota bacterium]|nr:MAG: hypothetical protein EYC68_01360 [Chloroflexota bacterium]
MNHTFSIRLPGGRLDLEVSTLVRVGMILGVLLLSAFLAMRAQVNFLFLLIGIGGLLVLLQAPRLGLIILLVGSLVLPFSIGTGTQTPINITVILIPVLLGVWVADMMRRRELKLAYSRTMWPLFALAASATVSLLAGSLPWNLFARTAPVNTQVAGWAIFIFSLGIFLLVGNLVDDVRWLKILVVLFLGISGLYMASRIAELPFSALMNYLHSDGSMFWVWTVAMAAGQLLFNRNLGRVGQLALAALILATIGIGFFQARDWASGWVPPMIALATILTLRSWRLGIVVIIAGIAYVVLERPEMFALETGVESYSILTRDVARNILVQQVFPLSPIIGLGPANYYWYTPLYPILGWYVNFNSHNNYVDILLQLGAVGMLCFIWLVTEIGLLGWRLRNRFKNNFAQGYVYGCIGGLVGSLAAAWLADWLFPFAYNIGLSGFRASILAWLFMGGLVALEQIARRSESKNS